MLKIETRVCVFFKCETFKYNANQVSGVHNTVALLLCCLCIRWLLMWSTNPWRSAITWKPMTGTSMVVTTFNGSSFNYTHCYTGCVLIAPALSGIIVYSKRSKRPPREETLSKWKYTFQDKKKVNQWRCVVSNKCTESDTTVIKLT